MAATRQRDVTRDRRIGRWAVVVIAAVLCTLLLLWYGLQEDRDGADTVDATVPAAGGDMIPPVDEGADDSPPLPQPDHTTTDVIPPEEP
jgi:hypothetical protein